MSGDLQVPQTPFPALPEFSLPGRPRSRRFEPVPASEWKGVQTTKVTKKSGDRQKKLFLPEVFVFLVAFVSLVVQIVIHLACGFVRGHSATCNRPLCFHPEDSPCAMVPSATARVLLPRLSQVIVPVTPGVGIETRESHRRSLPGSGRRVRIAAMSRFRLS